jgi:hypothetical protein
VIVGQERSLSAARLVGEQQATANPINNHVGLRIIWFV